MSDLKLMDASQAVLFDLGLAPAKIEALSRNSDALLRLIQLAESHGLTKRKPPPSPRQINLTVSLAVNAGRLGVEMRAFILRQVLEEQISTQTQLTEAIRYFEQGGRLNDEAAFCVACGIGIQLTRENIHLAVESQLSAQHAADWNDLRTTLASLKLDPQLRWADPAILKEETEAVLTHRLGPRPTRMKSKSQVALSKVDINPNEKNSIFEQGFLASLHKPGENPQVAEELRLEHSRVTGGRVVTRFPPEPNGFLHIGHAKAIAVNFGFAKYHGGLCYLRYDDTNPAKEEQVFFDNILTTIRWLGIEPDKVTYSSDYFDVLFDKAVELIKKDKAYVCQCTQEELEHGRGLRGQLQSREECVHRRRPIDISLAMFKKMKDGHPDVTNATLRMKQDLTDPNPQMWDLIAYRTHSTPHPRTGTRWKIYPTYDFTHCLVDSLENISHSLCTSEFVASRQSYEWLCHALGVYTPRQYEYGRLSLTHTVMSKRHLHKLVLGGQVSGWDDIRLSTLIGLRRRGVPPEGIMQFIRGLGVTTAMAETDLVKFDESIRQFLEPSTPRLFLILHPVKVIIENLPDDFLSMVEKPYHPKNSSMGTGTIPFTRVIYIDADDFRISGSNDYFRLFPGGSVGLLHVPHSITCTSFQVDIRGKVETIFAYYNNGQSVIKPKAYIHWVAECPSQRSPVRVSQVRLVEPLFKLPNPPKEAEIDENSLRIFHGAFIEVGFWGIAKQNLGAARNLANLRILNTRVQPGIPPIAEAQLAGPECVRFQGIRLGYFALDSSSDMSVLESGSQVDNDEINIVLNRIVPLKNGGLVA
ncbi:glutaminyl-tRNA synthetase [Mycena belliarum]|uniref:glutamine--tRNA ligase n=1 Tax=Mycena belliarum TaxID=1033014 RepID=A0AAD6XI03_9AGAR|nr:glutaminyl-tRNA synthetase [Mycena belliae]